MIRNSNQIETTLQRVFAVFGKQEPCELAAFDRDCWWYRYEVEATIDGRRIYGVLHPSYRRKPQMTDKSLWDVQSCPQRYDDSLLLARWVDEQLTAVEIRQETPKRNIDEIYHEVSEAEFAARLRATEIYSHSAEYRELQRERVVGWGLGW